MYIHRELEKEIAPFLKRKGDIIKLYKSNNNVFY